MMNCRVKYSDTYVNIEFPCTNITLFAKLADLHVPDEEKSKMDIYIEEVQKRLDSLLRMMDEREYHLLIGKAWLNECKNVNDMIAVAEGDMYEAKRLYYKKRENVSRNA